MLPFPIPGRGETTRVEMKYMRRNALAFIIWLSTTVLLYAQEPAPKLPVIG